MEFNIFSVIPTFLNRMCLYVAFNFSSEKYLLNSGILLVQPLLDKVTVVIVFKIEGLKGL